MLRRRLMVCALFLFTCKTQIAFSDEAPATAPNPADYTQKDFYREVLAFNHKEMGETYQAKGHHDPRWDAAAADALETLAVYDAQNSTAEVAAPAFFPTPPISEKQLGDTAQKAIDLGCDDPLVYYARALSLIYLGQTREARPWLEKSAAAVAGSPYSALRQYRILNRKRLLTDDPAAQKAAWPAVEQACVRMAKGPFMNAAAHREVALDVFQALAWLPHEQYEPALARMAAAAGVDSWVLQNAQTELQIDLAWDDRSSGLASTVTPAGWKGFESHLAKAQTAAEAAWRAHPELPETSTAMIRIAMGASADSQDDVQKWFDRAIAAQPDYGRAYSALYNALEPRWGGSVDQIIAAGQKAADTKRFDTAIPWQYIVALTRIGEDKLGGDPKIFERPDLRTAEEGIINSYIARWKGTPYENYFSSSLAALDCACGDNAAAKKILDQLPDLDPDATVLFNIYAARALQQVYLDTFPDQDQVKRYHDAGSRHNYDAAEQAINQILTADHPTGHALEVFQTYDAGLKMLKRFTTGEKLSLTTDDARCFWDSNFPYTTDNNTILTTGEDHFFITSRFYLPDRKYEIHVKFDFLDLHATRDRYLDLRWGVGNGDRFFSVLLSGDPPQVTVDAPGEDMGDNFPFPVQEHNAIDIVYSDRMPTLTLNGTTIPFRKADAATVQRMSKDNTLELIATAAVRVNEMTLLHLGAAPVSATAPATAASTAPATAPATQPRGRRGRGRGRGRGANTGGEPETAPADTLP